MYDSIRLAMKLNNINYIPGCAELGDFDATSTAIGVCPVGETAHMPTAALHATFDRYLAFCKDRIIGAAVWRDYTPYELRNVGVLVELGRRAEAFALLDFFFAHQYPPGWHHWAEVVHNPPTHPGFIGDMPHTWVGSEFLRSLRTLLVYHDESADALVLAAGVPHQWLASGEPITIGDWPTVRGTLSYTLTHRAGETRFHGALHGNEQPTALVLKPPITAGATIKLNGTELPEPYDPHTGVRITTPRFDVVFRTP
jgi:hypothetical protein